MGWEDEVEEIRRRQEMAKQMGGPESVARHHKAGKLTVRERIDQVLDSGSFREVGGLTGAAKYDDQGNLAPIHTGQHCHWDRSDQPTASSGFR